MSDLDCAGIYAIRHRESGKTYVGQSQNIAYRIRQHASLQRSSPHLRNAIRAYGWSAFEVIVLERIDDLARMDEREQFWITELGVCDHQRGYNCSPTAGTCRGVKHTATTRALESSQRKGRIPSPETRAKLSSVIRAINNGEAKPQGCKRTPPDEWLEWLEKSHTRQPKVYCENQRKRLVVEIVRQKIGVEEAQIRRRAGLQARRRMRIVSDETRVKSGMARKGKPGKPLTEEHIEKLRAANKGRKLSDEHKAKLLAARKQKGFRPMTDAEKKHLSEINQLKHHATERMAQVVDYFDCHPNATIAAIVEATGVAKTTVYKYLALADRKIEKRNDALYAETILQLLTDNPKATLTELAQATALPMSTVYTLLRQEGWKKEKGEWCRRRAIVICPHCGNEIDITI